MNTSTPGWANAATVSLDGLKVTLSQPVCVARSSNWLWFPQVYRLPNNDLAAIMSTVHDGDTTDTAMTAAWSFDGGLTWGELQPCPVVSYCALTLTNGNTLLLPFYLRLEGTNDLAGPCGVISNGTRSIARWENAVTVTNWPRQVRREALYGCRFVFHGQTLRLTNGLYFATLYGWFEGAARMSVVAATSPDGFHWSVQSVIADDACPLPGNEGPCETTTARLPDGRLMNVFRLDSHVLYGQSWSSDEGRTWTAPVNMAGPKSVEPSMIVMPSGVVALSGGRPGLWLWLDRKGDGKRWQAVDIRTHHNQCIPEEPITIVEGWNHHTTAYTELALLDDKNLLLIYDRIPNGHLHLPPPGVSNSIWVVRATVERAPLRPYQITHVGNADPTNESPAWTLYPPWGQGSWTLEGGSETTPSGTYDYWRIAATDNGAYYTAPEGANYLLDRNWVMEFKVRVPVSESTIHNACVSIMDGLDAWTLAFRTEGTEGVYYWPPGGEWPYPGALLKAMDVKSDYHTYKMAMRQGATDADDVVDVYIDGVLVTNLTRAAVYDYPAVNGMDFVVWGDNTGHTGSSSDMRFNYVKFESEPPPPSGTVTMIR